MEWVARAVALVVLPFFPDLARSCALLLLQRQGIAALSLTQTFPAACSVGFRLAFALQHDLFPPGLPPRGSAA